MTPCTTGSDRENRKNTPTAVTAEITSSKYFQKRLAKQYSKAFLIAKELKLLKEIVLNTLKTCNLTEVGKEQHSLVCWDFPLTRRQTASFGYKRTLTNLDNRHFPRVNCYHGYFPNVWVSRDWGWTLFNQQNTDMQSWGNVTGKLRVTQNDGWS